MNPNNNNSIYAITTAGPTVPFITLQTNANATLSVDTATGLASLDVISSGGTVTSIAVASAGSHSGALTVSGSPITTTGTIDLTLNLFSNTVAGIVPSSGGGSTNFLRADGSWESPNGGVTSVTGTSAQIDVSPTTGACVVSIDSSYIGQTSITKLGTITTGTWNGTTLAIANGGTGHTTQTAAFDALSPLTTQGDILYFNGTHNVRLGAGTSGYVLQTNGASANPTWVAQSSASFANPSASVGLSAVNGSATTAMRSDGAPALSQSISPTWTGNHTFTPSTGVGITVNAPSGQTAATFTTPSDDQITLNAGSGGRYSTVNFTNNGTSKAEIYWDNTTGLLNIASPSAGTVIDATSLTCAGPITSWNGSVAQSSGTAVSLKTLVNNGVYLVTANFSAVAAPAAYGTVAIVMIGAGVASISQIVTPEWGILSLSGLTVQYNQSAGGASTVYWTILQLM